MKRRQFLAASVVAPATLAWPKGNGSPEYDQMEPMLNLPVQYTLEDLLERLRWLEKRVNFLERQQHEDQHMLARSLCPEPISYTEFREWCSARGLAYRENECWPEVEDLWK